MGGGQKSSSPDSLSSEYFYLDNPNPQSTLRSRTRTPPIRKDKDEEKIKYDYGSGTEIASITPDNVEKTRKAAAFKQVLGSYSEQQRVREHLATAKLKILRYYPGAWAENIIDRDVPRTTTLLLVGPKGSGKSSLINRISRVFDNDEFGVDRAQVSYNSSGDGTCFLQEYMIPRGSESICLFDTRSLSDDPSENMEILERWMTDGVRHGDPDIRDSDSSSLKSRIYDKELSQGDQSKKKANFVIFVVNGLSVLKSMDGDDEAKRQFEEMVLTTFDCPFLSFRDDKPVIAVTHGDLLSLSDRARVRVYLGELLGIHPTKQIFDIPAESSDPVTDMAVVDMLRYALEHADRNLSGKMTLTDKVLYVLLGACVFLGIAMGIFMIALSVGGKRAYSATHVGGSPSCISWTYQPPPPLNHPPPLHDTTKVDLRPPPPDTNQPPPPDTNTNHQTPPPDTETDHQPAPSVQAKKQPPPPSVQPKEQSSDRPQKQPPPPSVKPKKRPPPTDSKEDLGTVRSRACTLTKNGVYVFG